MKTDYECAQIIDDSESDEEYIIMPKTKKLKTIKPKAPQPALKKCYNEIVKNFIQKRRLKKQPNM